MSNLYEDRKYLKDARTGERLFTTVVYDGDERIEGTAKVIERLRVAIPKIVNTIRRKGFGYA